MAIKKIEISNFAMFKDFSLKPCQGINVLIGENGAGKTTLLKKMFSITKEIEFHRGLPDSSGKVIYDIGQNSVSYDETTLHLCITENLHAVYIPEKDILEHAKGLIPFIEQKQTGFDSIYRTVLISAQDIPTSTQTEMQKSICNKITDIIEGEVFLDRSEGAYYTKKANGQSIPFSNEASGFKKLGFIGLLVASGRLAPGSILFWDEPENSMNPRLIPALVDILLELSHGSVQIFIATHSYMVAKYLDLRKKDNSDLIFVSMLKEDGVVSTAISESYNALQPNPIETSEEHLYQEVVKKVAEDNGWQT